MSGTDGRSTLPCDNSCASAFTKPNTTVFGIARDSIVLVASALAHTLSACRSASISSRDSASAARAGVGIQPQAARGGHAGKANLLGLRLRPERDQRGAGRRARRSRSMAPACSRARFATGADRLDDLGVHVPVAQDGLRHAQVIFGCDAVERRIVREQRGIARRARQ